jgi:hypothetical protein
VFFAWASVYSALACELVSLSRRRGHPLPLLLCWGVAAAMACALLVALFSRPFYGRVPAWLGGGQPARARMVLRPGAEGFAVELGLPLLPQPAARLYPATVADRRERSRVPRVPRRQGPAARLHAGPGRRRRYCLRASAPPCGRAGPVAAAHDTAHPPATTSRALARGFC